MDSPGTQANAGLPDTGPGPCPHCGSRDVIPGLKLNQQAEVGRIGLPYKTGVLFVGTEPLLADLCRACGSVVRFFVADPNRNWVK